MIDRSQFIQRSRYTYREVHVDWDETNNHLWSETCQRQNEHDQEIDPEHYELLDQATGETIPWAIVELVQ